MRSPILPAIAIGLFSLTSCIKPPSAEFLRIDPALATLIPPETVILVGTKVEKLRDTPIYKKYFADFSSANLDEFIRTTGIDVRKDVWELLFCGVDTKSGVMMIRGKFAPMDLEPKLEKQGAERFPYKGYSLFGNDRTAMFFMTPSVALAGSTSVLKSVIDGRDHTRAGVPPSLKPLVDGLPSGAQFWAVFTGGVTPGVQFPESGMLGNLNQIVRVIESGWLSADLRTGLDLTVTGNCTDDDGARKIRDLLKGVVGFGRLNTPDNQPELLRAFDAIRVEQQAKNVKLVAAVDEQLAEKLIDTFMKPISSGAGSRRPGSLNPRPR